MTTSDRTSGLEAWERIHLLNEAYWRTHTASGGRKATGPLWSMVVRELEEQDRRERERGAA